MKKKNILLSLMLIISLLTACQIQDNPKATNDLINAAYNGDIALIDKALQEGGDINKSVLSSPSKQSGPALVAATKAQHTDIVKYLLTKGANPSSALICACDNNNVEIIKILLDAGANPNESAFLIHTTPLMISSAVGNFQVVKDLIAKGAKINATDIDGETALLFAASNGHKEIVKYLLDKGAKPNIKNKYGETPIQRARARSAKSQDYVDIANMLLAKGAKDDSAQMAHYLSGELRYAVEDNKTAEVKRLLDMGAEIDNPIILFKACENGNEEIVKYLLDKGANPNEISYDGLPLQVTAQKGYLEIAKLLLNKGADPNNLYRARNFAMPLEEAVMNNRTEVVKLLLDKGADINICSAILTKAAGKNYLKTAKVLLDNREFSYDDMYSARNAARENGHKEMNYLLSKYQTKEEKKLLQAARKGDLSYLDENLYVGLDVNIQDQDGLTPLMIVVKQGNKKAVRILMDYSANVDIKNYKQETALSLAKKSGNKEIIKMLEENGAYTDPNKKLLRGAELNNCTLVKDAVDEGAKVNIKNNFGYTPLMFAVTKNNIYMVKYLIEKGAKLETKSSKEGFTAFMLAAQEDFVEITEFLIKKGANINATDKEGITALMLASDRNHTKIIKLLLDNKANPNLQDKEGMTALMFAIDKLHKNTVELLIKNHANVNLRDNQGWTAVNWLKNRKAPEITQMLLEAGAQKGTPKNNINTKAPNEQLLDASVLKDEQKKDSIKLALEALKNGADINYQDKEKGYTALMYACISENEKFVDFLLSKGAKVNIQNKNGFTALVFAVENGNINITRKLLEHFADPNIKDKDGFTALDVANYKQNNKMINLLTVSGSK